MFCFKQQTAYEMRISDWSSDVCASDLGEAQVLLGGDVAEHRGAVPADHRGADAAGDMVVARRDIGGERPERVEGRLAARLQLLVPILLDLVHRHVAGAFDHHLDVLCPGALGQLAPRVEFGRSAEHTSELQSLMRLSYAF